MSDVATATGRSMRPPVENERLTAWIDRTSTQMAPLLNATVRGLMRATARASAQLGVGQVVPEPASARLAVRITHREVVSADGSVVSLVLGSADRTSLPAWFPGAHVDVFLPSGRQRSYSLCGDPADRDLYRIAVRLIDDGLGGSAEVHDLAIGTTITVSHPRNAFAFAPRGHLPRGPRRVRFVAGGIGITPILAMAEHAERLGVDYSLLYLGRSADSLAFVDRVRALGDRAVIHTDDVDSVLPIETVVGELDGDTAVYVCGPPPLIAAVDDVCGPAAGVELHFERFTAPEIVDGRPFQVTLARTGHVLDVAADESMLDTILRARPDALYSCKQGFCRTCRLHVVDGAPDHRDSALTPAEREAGALLPCVSRGDGDLVVDL